MTRRVASRYDPPSPWATFYIRLYEGKAPSSRSTTTVVDRLADEELAWIRRVIEAEAARRGQKEGR